MVGNETNGWKDVVWKGEVISKTNECDGILLDVSVNKTNSRIWIYDTRTRKGVGVTFHPDHIQLGTPKDIELLVDGLNHKITKKQYRQKNPKGAEDFTQIRITKIEEEQSSSKEVV